MSHIRYCFLGLRVKTSPSAPLPPATPTDAMFATTSMVGKYGASVLCLVYVSQQSTGTQQQETPVLFKSRR